MKELNTISHKGLTYIMTKMLLTFVSNESQRQNFRY